SPRRNQQARSGCPHQNSHHLPPLHAAPATKRWQDSIGRKQGIVRRCHQRLSRSVLVSVAAPYSANTPVIALNSDGSAAVAVTVPRDIIVRAVAVVAVTVSWATDTNPEAWSFKVHPLGQARRRSGSSHRSDQPERHHDFRNHDLFLLFIHPYSDEPRPSVQARQVASNALEHPPSVQPWRSVSFDSTKLCPPGGLYKSNLAVPTCISHVDVAARGHRAVPSGLIGS